MLGWIFKKKGNTPGPTPTVSPKSPPPPRAPAAPPAPPAPVVDWAARLAQAQGDDEVLLTLVRATDTPLRFKLAAVDALDGEAALKAAEREFRSHDRRVHQLTKRRLLAKVAQRETRERAARLIETARGLVGQTDVPVNRCVELDRAWQALDAAATEPAQRETFAALTAQLAAQMRQRTDIDLQRQRWQADAALSLQRLQAACTEAAAGTQDRAALAHATGTARGIAEALPPGATAATDGARADLQRALQTAALLDQRLALLERLLAGPTDAARAADAGPDEPVAATAEAGAGHTNDATEATPDEPEAARAVAAPPADDAQRDPQQDAQLEWQALPALPDTQLAALLQARLAAWQQARDQARQDRQTHRREQARDRQRTRRSDQAVALDEELAQAETALDAGRLADAQRHLGAIDDALHGGDAPEALRARITAAQARLAQLRGWQHWSGARARDELVLQAEALAAATVAASAGQGDGGRDSGGTAEGEVAGTSAAEADVARLSIRQRAEVIATLRARWKEVDQLGSPGGRALWQRFDAALKAADAPVAAHVAAQRAARETNLATRRQLLDALEAVDVAAPVDDAAAALATGNAAAETPADAHAWATALDRFQVEWRKLGPLQHTVPRAACAALVARMEAAVRRIELPLQAARHQARAEREALVARARTLADEGPGRGRDLPGEARALQAEWQRHAKALPLSRGDEQALWTAFKAAIDAAFAAREAVFSARDAEFEAHAAERAALIERLQARADDNPAAQRRTLAEVDAAWQRCGPAPRARAAALDAEYRAARDTLRQWLDDTQQRAWLASCDALDAKLALCLAREQGAGSAADPAALVASWQALPALPAPFEHALRQRAGLAPAQDSARPPAVDELLLQIETAWDLPTPPAHAAARRERKLLAMKAALEGRRTAAPEDLPPDAALAHLLGLSGVDVGQHDRLAAILSARRRRGPQRPG